MKPLNYYFIVILFLLSIPNLTNAQIAFSLASEHVDIGTDIAIDDQGNAFVLGTFRGAIDFDLTSETFEIQHDGKNHKDIFIASYSSSGKLRFAFPISTFSFALDEEALGLALDNDGNVYVTGWYNGIVDFDPSSGVFELVSDNTFSGTGFLASYTNTGELRFAINIGISSYPSIIEQLNIQIDANNNVYISGIFQGVVDFDPSSNVVELDADGSIKHFIASYDSQGNLLFAEKLYDLADVLLSLRLAVDNDGNSYLAGRIDHAFNFDFDPGQDTFQLTDVNPGDIFVSSFSNKGEFKNAFKIDCESIPFRSFEEGTHIVVDNDDNICISGTMRGETDFDPSMGTFVLDTEFNDEFYFASYTNDGNLRHAFILGNEENSFDTIETVIPSSMVSDEDGNIYLVGIFNGSIDFDPSNGVFELDASQNGVNSDNTDIFTVSYNNQGNLRFANRIGLDDITVHKVGKISVNSGSESCITGSIYALIEYDQNNNAYNIIKDWDPNVFVTCYSADGTLVSTKELDVISSKNNIIVFPNPSSEMINIYKANGVEFSEVVLSAINGEIVFRATMNERLEIDLSDIPKGYYILSVCDSSGKTSKPIVKIE